jgi:hypothetical protein
MSDLENLMAHLKAMASLYRIHPDCYMFVPKADKGRMDLLYDKLVRKYAELLLSFEEAGVCRLPDDVRQHCADVLS